MSVIHVDFRTKKVISREDSAKENNERVLQKMKDGDNLCTSTLEDTWFPAHGVFDRKLGRMVPTKPSQP